MVVESLSCLKSTLKSRQQQQLQLKGGRRQPLRLRLVSSRSSTLGSFSRMRKAGGSRRGEGVSSGPLVILSPPPSSTSGLSSTTLKNFPQNAATDDMDSQPIQPFNNQPPTPDTSPSSPLIEDSGMCVSLAFIIVKVIMTWLYSKCWDQASNVDTYSGCSLPKPLFFQDQSH